MPSLPSKGAGIAAGAAVSLLLFSSVPVLAHHLMDINGLAPTPLNGLLSGLAHPVIGPDHLMFLLALSLVALRRPLGWVMALLAIGLIGSGVGLLWPSLPGAEVLVSLSLVVEALVILDVLAPAVLVPAMAVHGYVLSDSVVGWSSMPLGSYVLGLLISQGLLLLVTQTALRRAATQLHKPLRQALALGLVGCGLAWALAQGLA